MQLQGHQLSLFLDRLFTDLLDNPQRCGSRLPTNFYTLGSADSKQTNSQNVIAYFSFTHKSDDPNIYLNILSSFFLLYKGLDPITETVLNASAKQFYHDSFQTILKFRFSKWISENLRIDHRLFTRLGRPGLTPGYQCYHLLFLVRHRLLYALNTMYASMMERIDQHVAELQQNVAQAQDYEQMRDCFERFRDRVQHCLWANKKDTKSILMSNLLSTLSDNVFRMRQLWQQLMKQFDRFHRKQTINSTGSMDSQEQDEQNQSNPDDFDYQSALEELRQMYDFLVNNSKIYRLFENV